MNYKKLWLIIAAILLVSLIGGVGRATQNGLSRNWGVMAGGGGISTSGELVELKGTVGQALVGASSATSGDIQFSSGFWGGVESWSHRLFLPVVLMAP